MGGELDHRPVALTAPLRGASMQRCALLDWSVRLRGANPNYAPRTPQQSFEHTPSSSCLGGALPRLFPEVWATPFEYSWWMITL
jgi:hypothetical protein